MNQPTRSVARYEEIRSALEKKILRGDWVPGMRIPSEAQLVAQYGYSRMTIHRALCELASAGLLQRRQGKRTFVASPPSHMTVLEITDVRAEISAMGEVHRHSVLTRQIQAHGPDHTERLGTAAQASRVLHLLVQHFASAVPFVLEQRVINLDAVAEAEVETFEAIPPGTWLLEQVPWSDAEHRIKAALADQETAESLQIPIGAPCLVIERRTFHSNRPITWVRLMYPADRHELVGSFTYAKYR